MQFKKSYSYRKFLEFSTEVKILGKLVRKIISRKIGKKIGVDEKFYKL